MRAREHICIPDVLLLLFLLHGVLSMDPWTNICEHESVSGRLNVVVKYMSSTGSQGQKRPMCQISGVVPKVVRVVARGDSQARLRSANFEHEVRP